MEGFFFQNRCKFQFIWLKKPGRPCEDIGVLNLVKFQLIVVGSIITVEARKLFGKFAITSSSRIVICRR